LAADWRFSERLNFKLSYSYLQIQLHLDGDSGDPISELAEGDSPHHQVSLRSSINITNDLDLDLWARYVDNLSSQDIGSYISLDTHIAWRPLHNLEFSLVGQNLIDSQRAEFNQDTFLDVATSEVERSVYGKFTLWL
jgi:iron complex outermembrane receptor protein